MTRSPTFSPAAEQTTPPQTSGPPAPRPSPPGPTSPASPWLHNHAYRRASLSPSRFPSICRSQVDGALWVQGYPDQAVRTASAGVDEAAAIDHAISLGFALADGACPVSAWVGDTAATARFVGMLSARAEKLGLAIWHAHGLAWRGWLADREGDSETAIALLDAAIGEFRATQFDLHFTTFLGAFAEILTRAGRVADGVATISDAVTRAELTEERWCFPELLRIQGNITRRLSGPDATQLATDLYMRALDWARRHSALSWELGAATSLAGLLRDQGRSAAAIPLLQPVYDQFTEGFDTA